MANADDCARDDDDNDLFDVPESCLESIKHYYGMIIYKLSGEYNGYGLTDKALRHVRSDLDSILKYVNDAGLIIRRQDVMDALRRELRYRELCQARGVIPGDRLTDDEYYAFMEIAEPMRIQDPNWRGNKKLRAEVAELYSDKPDA